MRFTQLGAAAALVAATQAFLLPPTITSADTDIINTLPFEDAINIQDRIVEVDCPGCPVLVPDVQGNIHSVQTESVLRLNFTLSLGDNDRLLMNDLQIYPMDLRPSALMEPLRVDQLAKGPDGILQYVGAPQIGYAIAISHPTVQSNKEMDLALIKVEIIEVADTFVKPLEAVVVKVLETPSGKLMIGDVEIITIPDHNPGSRLSAGGSDCTTLLCKWRAIIADKLEKAKGSIKGCAGKKGRPGAHGVRPHGHGRPRPHGHHPHGHHHRHGSFARFLRSIVLHVFIPILIGIVVGVTTSLVGMVVGHVIVFIWRVLFRRGARGQYRRVQQEEAVKAEDLETKSFLQNQGPPPTYEDAPAYEEAIVDEKSAQ